MERANKIPGRTELSHGTLSNYQAGVKPSQSMLTKIVGLSQNKPNIFLKTSEHSKYNNSYYIEISIFHFYGSQFRS